jgi:putative restriction endonuclease
LNFWWVNQNQTSAQEIAGGYLWSPKLSQDGRKQLSYENMKGIEPGDLVLAYSNKKIGHYGIATERALSWPKPQEFGNLGSHWSHDGWYVRVVWTAIEPIDRDHVGRHAQRLFREFETPFSVNSTVKQSYLFRISKEAADFILGLAKVPESKFMHESLTLEPTFFAEEAVLDGYIEKGLLQNTTIDRTEKEILIQARRGQGRFRENLSKIERECRITGVQDQRLLIASHIKPWRSCASNFERLDGHNGLLLTPTMDRLFDRRYLTFEDDGTVILSDRISEEVYEKVGLDYKRKLNVGPFQTKQTEYLKYHREIFLG